MPKLTIINNSSVPIHGLAPGATRKIDVDDHGIPIDQNWRRRLKDSAIDGAITPVLTKHEKKPSKKEKED